MVNTDINLKGFSQLQIAALLLLAPSDVVSPPPSFPRESTQNVL